MTILSVVEYIFSATLLGILTEREISYENVAQYKTFVFGISDT